ncbi:MULTISPECIES: D-lactate dehydrogenase [unclassified Psychrobacter]|uniref:D-lactate dehydrogenase n=1 Tax=unclassified Psychrobacter TaxID=196806 RepID=UPI000EDD4FBB|nr:MULTISPECIES: D-lactate dehydrogenase [unclassified Psychrobacter]MBE8610220.1 D-lactate dehydrogenase [Pseudomonas lundensis]HCI76360.1 D-lactate dehydrogenase [Psychrobacter sp.]
MMPHANRSSGRLSTSLASLLTDLSAVVGATNVLTKSSQQQSYTQGAIASITDAVAAVVIPDSLVALWRVINLCAAVDVIIIAQAANTGLTGGSTPYGEYDRAVVVISMQRLGGVHLLNDAAELVALPAASLQQLESQLAPLGREPHSVLGSSCVGASVIGGICNSSGGMLVQRGPAYTEMSLFAKRNAMGEFELINHLGIDLGADPEEMLRNLQTGTFNKNPNSISSKSCTNHHYQHKVRDCEADTPARFNNDPNGLYEASGSAGKVIVFAVRVATFAKPTQEQTFYISTNDADTLTTLRQQWLKSELNLPILAEYMHKNYNDITMRYGRDTCLSMRKLPAGKIGGLYRLQAKIGYYLNKWRLPQTLPDRLLQMTGIFMPPSLPNSLAEQACSYRYHLIIKVADGNNTYDDNSDDNGSHGHIAAAQAFLQSHMQQHKGVVHLCTAAESQALLVFRSAATAAMFRYHNLNHTTFGELLSTDIALPRNAVDWDEVLPINLQKQVSKTFYLGHFFCHVMHQDYLLYPEVDAKKFKDELLAFYDRRRIEYPAEHNVGHVYTAKPALHTFYKKLDPTNSLNPGIGQTAKWKNWRSSPIKEELNDELSR